jgi:hypothetical protein
MLHVLRIDEQLVETGKARGVAELEMAVSALHPQPGVYVGLPTHRAGWGVLVELLRSGRRCLRSDSGPGAQHVRGGTDNAQLRRRWTIAKWACTRGGARTLRRIRHIDETESFATFVRPPESRR